MSTRKAPPAWAIELGRTIAYDFGEPRYQEAGYGIAQAIAASAPDAEALAVLLGEYLREFDGPHTNREMKQWLDNDWIPSVRDALRQYRVRFPQSQETTR